MGKSTQKVDQGDIVSNSCAPFLPQSHRKSCKVARLKASKLQEAPKTAKNIVVFKGFKSNVRHFSP